MCVVLSSKQQKYTLEFRGRLLQIITVVQKLFGERPLVFLVSLLCCNNNNNNNNKNLKAPFPTLKDTVEVKKSFKGNTIKKERNKL